MAENSPRSLLRILRWPLIIVAALALLVWGGSAWLMSSARTKLNERLATRGLELTCKSESWSPWHGITLEEAVLRRRGGKQEQVAALSALHVDVQWQATWEARSAVTNWQASDETLVVQDEEGSVTLPHFTASFMVRDGQVAVDRLRMHHGPAFFDVSGEVLTATGEGGPKEEFQLNLKALRGVLNTLYFTGEGEFKITGTFNLDARKRPFVWKATLQGEGGNVAWRNVPLQEAHSEAQLSEAGMTVANKIKFPHGSANVEIKREGWKQTPLNLTGTLTDSAGTADEFSGAYLTPERTLTIASLTGKADLLDLAQNVPALADKLPRSLTVKTFPDIAAKDFVCVFQGDGGPPKWSLKNLQLRSPADIAVMVQKHPLNIEDLTGSIGYEDKSWQFNRMKGKLLGGSFALAGNYDGQVLSKADIDLQSLNLSRFGPWFGKISGKLDDSELTMAYNGSICGRDPKRSTGGGSLVLTSAPVVHIPVLDQAYSLFPKLLPRKGSSGTGEFQVTFVMTKGVATIDPFKARSEAVTVTAKGTVDLVRRHVSGHARANLRGLVGVATAPLSVVLTDMDIEGPIDNVRISPQGPVAAVKGAVKAATGGAKFSSKVLGTSLALPFYALGMFEDD